MPPCRVQRRGKSTTLDALGGSSQRFALPLSLIMSDRRWNRADFELVIRSHELTDAALAQLLPKRRMAEIRRLRQTLHEYHVSGRRLVPDDSMSVHLLRLQGELVCASCGQQY